MVSKFYPVCGCLILCLGMPGGAQGDELLSGGSISLVDSQHNSSNWAAANLTDNNLRSRWLSREQSNDINFIFNAAKDSACFGTVDLTNYGNDDRAIERFMLLHAVDGSLASDNGIGGWQRVAANPSPNYPLNYMLWAQGGRLLATDSQLNTSTWASEHLLDGDHSSRWLSTKGNNSHQFAFDTDWDGAIGNKINVESLFIHNYGADDRSVKDFLVEVTQDGTHWQKLRVPGTAGGDADFNFSLVWEGGQLAGIDSQLNATSWAASRIHDGDHNTRWLSNKANNILTFGFDPDLDGIPAESDSDDEFNLHKFYLQNYGADDRSVHLFQVEVQTAKDSSWRKLEMPGSVPGEANFNFAFKHEGGLITGIDSELNTTTWAAANIHDGNQNTRWLSSKGNNLLTFEFDPNGDGVSSASGDVTDQFTLEKIYLRNYGSDDRALNQFQVEVMTRSDPDWRKLEVPGTAAGDSGYEFSLVHNGARLSAIDSQLNSTTWAAANIHDGDLATRWLSPNQDNELIIVFDTDLDGNTGDAINVDTLHFSNYGNDDRAVATFAVDAEIGGSWVAVADTSGTTVFNSSMGSLRQQWSVGPYHGVTRIRLRTLTNHGDSHYTGAREFTVSGTSVGPSHTFAAAMHGAGETFVLDPADQVSDITSVRLRTINNHGDPTYTGARELELLGDSLHAHHTFAAAMHGNGETFDLGVAGRVSGVTAARLVTISNHGDPHYTGAREFALLGPSLGPSRLFSLPMSTGPHQIDLAAADQVSGVVGVRLLTVNNHGDPTYTGMQDFGILGTPVGPDYLFYAPMSAATQSYSFAPVEGKVLRFHSINSHGDTQYTGATELQVYGNLGSCCSLGGFEITQPLTGIACPGSRAEVNIRAICSDGLTPKTDYQGTIQLSTASGSEFFAAASGGSPLSVHTINAADSGSAQLYLFHDDVADDVKVTVTDQAEAVTTTATAGTDFGAQGFRVYQQPTDTVCGLTTSLGIEAFGQVPGGNCERLSGFSGTKPVKAWFEAELDGTTGIDDTTTPLTLSAGICVDSSLNGDCVFDEGQPATSNLILNFNQGQSTLGIAHRDAAKINGIHFLHDESPYDGSGFPALQATTGSFVMTPSALQLTIPGEPDWQATSGASSSVFKKAGEEFSLAISAICDGDQVAAHFRSQNVIALGHKLTEPVGGVAGTLQETNTRIDSTAVAGVKTVRQAISEVGIFGLTATLPANSYFGQSIQSATLADVGRFTPAYLEMTANTPALTVPAGCPSPNAWTFAYQQQPFSMSTHPSVLVTGKNKAGATTLNYHAGFFNFSNGQSGRSYQNNTGSAATLSFDSGITGFDDNTAFDGAKLMTINDFNFVYNKANTLPTTADAPFFTNVTLNLASADLMDGDGICYQDDAGSACRSLSFTNIAGPEIRYGRLRMENAFGSELEDHILPVSAEYWNGSDWLTNSADDCTTIGTTAFKFTNYTDRLNSGETSASIGGVGAGSTTLVNGVSTAFLLTKPGAGNEGSVDVFLDKQKLDDWLKYDWDNDPATDDVPTATASFGHFRGHDRIIYWREVIQ